MDWFWPNVCRRFFGLRPFWPPEPEHLGRVTHPVELAPWWGRGDDLVYGKPPRPPRPHGAVDHEEFGYSKRA